MSPRRYNALEDGGFIKRASAPSFSPTDIADLFYWYDSDASRVTQVAGAVSALEERYCSVALAPLNAPGGAPTWSATAGTLAAPGIRYNAGAGTVRLQSTDTVIAAALTSSGFVSFTWVHVAERIAAPAAVLQGLAGINATGTANRNLRLTLSSAYRGDLRRNAATATSAVTTTINQPFFLAVTSDPIAGDVVYYQDAAVDDTGYAITSLAACNQFTLGNVGTGGGAAFASPFSGWIHESLLYLRQLTAVEVGQLRAYYKSVYPGLP